MPLLILVAALITSAHNGQRNFEECKAQDFAPKSCWEAKQLYKAGKFGCEVQGKKYVGNTADDNNGCAK